MLEPLKANSCNYKLIIFDWEGTLAKCDGCLFTGVKETLQLLIKNGFSCAIATSMCLSRLKNLLTETDIQQYFSYLQSADCGTTKPDPKMLTEVLAHTLYNNNEALMVGDSIYDVSMAENAHIAAVGVLSGTDTKERLANAKPQAILDSVNDLPNYLNLSECN